ncbi:hypothetical protein Ocin01_08886 [Orchesella cincta]|uniref:Uncharacterized protein n=1 Tax=Orchesella cincta TaxID=48709 RepID=A0A1D2MXK8_ORCCI|nr:hypothetical protein Ocin01_08886 [Orchesella cincta]
MALLDNETVVDLQSDEGTDPNQPLIPSSRCSSNIKKLISAGFIILLCLSFITWLACGNRKRNYTTFTHNHRSPRTPSYNKASTKECYGYDCKGFTLSCF